MANSPAISNMTSTNLDKAFQRVASTMKTLSRPSCVQTNVGLSTSKVLDVTGFANHIVHWLKSKLGRDTNAPASFDTDIKSYLTQLRCTNDMAITFFTKLVIYPDP